MFHRELHANAVPPAHCQQAKIVADRKDSGM